MSRTTLLTAAGGVACLGVLAGLLTAQSPGDKPQAQIVVKLPPPPPRLADAAEQAKTCLECHDEMVDLFDGDKHIADDFHCVVCHGPSKAHLEMEEEGALPDRTWRRWIEDDNAYKWRVENAPLEIAKFCASCHGREPAKENHTKTIDWKSYLDSGHGRAAFRGAQDGATCTDCHYAHGAGCEPLTDETIVKRCSLCHADKEMMERVNLDPNVIEEFEAGTHQNMDSVSPEEKSSCVKCHPPH